MGFLDLFNKLIVEHGSAEIQSKHIALVREQLTLADKRIIELESENALLKSKLENAETTIQEQAVVIDELRAKIQEYEKIQKNPSRKQERGEAWNPLDEL